MLFHSFCKAWMTTIYMRMIPILGPPTDVDPKIWNRAMVKTRNREGRQRPLYDGKWCQPTPSHQFRLSSLPDERNNQLVFRCCDGARNYAHPLYLCKILIFVRKARNSIAFESYPRTVDSKLDRFLHEPMYGPVHRVRLGIVKQFNCFSAGYGFRVFFLSYFSRGAKSVSQANESDMAIFRQSHASFTSHAWCVENWTSFVMELVRFRIVVCEQLKILEIFL